MASLRQTDMLSQRTCLARWLRLALAETNVAYAAPNGKEIASSSFNLLLRSQAWQKCFNQQAWRSRLKLILG